MGKDTSRKADVPESLMTQAVMAAPWGFAITDHQRKGNPVVFVNQAFNFIGGHEADDVLGKSWSCLLGREPESISLARIQEAVSQSSHCSVRLQSTEKDISPFHYELTIAPVLNRSGDVTHFTWLQRDVSSLFKDMTSLINEKEKRFTSYVSNATEAIWRIDFKPPIRLDAPESQQVRDIFENGFYSEANNAAASIYGLSKGIDLIGRPLSDFMEEAQPENVERVAEYVRNKFDMKNLITYEQDVDRNMHVGVNNISPFIEDGQVLFIWGASLDVTEHFAVLRALEVSKTELAEKAAALEEKNIALRELVASIELEKKDFKDRIVANIERVVLPSLDKIRVKSDSTAYIEQHRQTLEDLTSSFGHRIADVKLRLTPREIEICNLVKNGMASKEIAAMLNIALHTVEKHRRTARNKLDLANKGINLRTYLNSL